MRRILPLCLLLLGLFPVTAQADTFNFTLDQTITFSLSEPLRGTAFNHFDFRLFDFPIDFNGHQTTAQLDLFSSDIGGGLNLTYFFPGGPGHITALGPQLFSGTTADPTILTGNFDLTDAGKSNIHTLTITSDAVASTPEPATLTLLATGVLGLVLLSKQKMATGH
jgi:hypothetical protein